MAGMMAHNSGFLEPSSKTMTAVIVPMTASTVHVVEASCFHYFTVQTAQAYHLNVLERH